MSLTSWLWALAALVVAYNAHSLPFVWHVRVMTPVFRLWRRRNNSHALIRSTLSQDPSKLKITVPGFRVWPSDVDYNMHKSNSTYASDMDVARSNVAVECFGPFLSAGGILPIAGTTHRFIHEIKPMVSYDIEISFGGWGEKWMYCVGLFVTRPTHPKSLASTANGGPKSGTISGASTPLTRKLATTRADGSIVHAVSVSTFCFKLGRLTVPPAVALSMCGYGPSSSSARTHRLHALGPRAVVKYLKGGWKEDPEAVTSVESYEQMGERMGDRGDLMRQALEAFGVEASD